MNKVIFFTTTILSTLFFSSLWVFYLIENRSETYYWFLSCPFIILISILSGITIGMWSVVVYRVLSLVNFDKN
jgi:hypothetical protein